MVHSIAHYVATLFISISVDYHLGLYNVISVLLKNATFITTTEIDR